MHSVTRTLTAHYDACLAKHGPTPQGMDWGADDSRLQTRFHTICRAIGLHESHGRESAPITVLDAGCGCGLFLDHLKQFHPDQVEYMGLDASKNMIAAASQKHAGATFSVGDITTMNAHPVFDWVVANGLVTERRHHSQDEMTAFACNVVRAMFDRCRIGIVFNVMSTHVNYRDPALFYWEPEGVLLFLVGEVSRHVCLHHDLPTYDCFYAVRRQPWTGGHHV